MTEAMYRPDVVAGKFNRDLFDPSGETLLINEVFYSLQGEGDNAGRAAVFIRLAKCNLACKFCDTEFEIYTKQSLGRILEEVLCRIPEVEGALKLARTEARQADLIGFEKRDMRPWVVLTGGEPLLQNCEPLVAALHAEGFKVAVETSGSVWSPWVQGVDHVCISPKVPWERVPQELKDAADEVKWIVNSTFLAMVDGGKTVWAPGVTNYLQPESQVQRWTTAASKLVMAYPWKYRLSLQTHKYANLP